jgi:hypothetical protein
MNLKKKHKHINNNYYYIIFLFLIAVKVIFFEKHYITYDELYSVINYTNYYTLFLKDNLNNHIINSFFGIIIGNFTIKIDYLRFISSLFFFSGIFLIILRLQFKITLILIFICFIYGNNLYVYSFLYRGYPYYFFLFSLAFYLLDQEEITKLKIKIILIILAILTSLAPSNILLIFPLIFFYRKKFSKVNILFYYFFLTSLFIFPSIILTGVYSLRDNLNLQNINYLYFLNIENLFNIFFNGLSEYYNLIFNFYEKINLTRKIEIIFRDDKIIFLFYIIFIFCFFLKIIKKYEINSFDKIFIAHIATILIISNVHYARVYYPFYAFYFILLDKNLHSLFNNNFFEKRIVNIILIPLFFISMNVNLDKKLNSNYDIKKHYAGIKKSSIDYENNFKKICLLTDLPFNQLEIDIYYYNYLAFCKKKIDIFEIKKIQKKHRKLN